MILLIDNYDSFVYNLARYLRELGCDTRVVRNDALSVSEIRQLAPQAIVLSPGPCSPQEAGISVPIVKEFAGTIPILGICLGHQAIGAAFGGNVIRAAEPIHGETSFIDHSGTQLFAGIETPLRVGRYHSLILEVDSLPGELNVVATTRDGIIMSLEHSSWPVFGTQFHPESVLTNDGHRILQNFLALAAIHVSPNLSKEQLPEFKSRVDIPESTVWRPH